MNLRIARSADVAQLVAASADFFSGAPALPAPEPDELAAWIARLVAHGTVIVAEEEGRYVGSIALQRDRFPWSTAPQLMERWFHVLSDRRGSRAAVQLRDAARAVAARLGLTLWLGDLTGRDALRKAAWHERAGGQLVGAMVRFQAR